MTEQRPRSAVQSTMSAVKADQPIQPLMSAVRGLRSASASPPLPEFRRLHLIDLPAEKIVIARPRMDFGGADLAAEAAGMLGGMLLPCRAVGQRATRTAEIFDREKTACHSAMMLRLAHIFQSGPLP